MLNQAKAAATIVLRVLKNLSEVEWEKETFTRVDVELHAEKMYDIPPFDDAIKLGYT